MGKLWYGNCGSDTGAGGRQGGSGRAGQSGETEEVEGRRTG